MRLADRVALVTGAGSGIGREIACTLAMEGAKIAAVDLRPETAEETLGLLAGDGHFACAVDVSDPDSVRDMVGRCPSRPDRRPREQRRVDASGVGASGSSRPVSRRYMSDEGFTKLMAINVNGVFFCLRESLKVMQREERGGSSSTCRASPASRPTGT